MRFIINSNKVLENLFKKDFDLKNTIILSEEPNLRKGDRLYFISDTYYPGWKAYVDGIETKIYKADFNFKAIVTSKESKDIKFVYQPDSFYNGIKISLVSFAILFIIGIATHLWRKKY